MKRILIIGLLAAFVGAAIGCDEAQRKEWTIKASIIETRLVAGSPLWPENVPRMSEEEMDAFGMTRVLVYEVYGAQLKAAVEGLKD